MITLLFHHEHTAIKVDHSYIDQCLGAFGFGWAVIDLVGDLKSSSCVFASLLEAKQKLIGPWIYLDHRADSFIDEFNHPNDGVYCVGPDNGVIDIDGPSVKIRTRDPKRPLFAQACVPLVAYDIWLFHNGVRN